MQKGREYINSNTFYYPNQKLGDGSFGTVFKGMLIKEDCYVAIKKRKSFNKQIQALKNVRHNNIVKFYGCLEIQQKNACFIILEFCEGGTLTQQIEKNGKIPQLVCLRYIKQIVHAMASVTNQNIIHRDIKPANILLTISKEIKICDFGVARKMIGDDPNVIMGGMTNGAGTPYTMAPEVLLSDTYGAKCDVWSIGVVLVEMLTGKNIFQQCKSVIQLFNTQNKLSIQGYDLMGKYNDFFKMIVKKTLTFEQNIRMTINDLKKLIDDNYNNIKKQLGFQQITVINQGVISNQIPQNNVRIDNIASKFGKIKILECIKTPNQINKQKQNSHQTSPSPFNNHKKQSQSPQPILKLNKHNVTQLEQDLKSKEESQILFQNFKLYMKYLIEQYDLYITFNKYNFDNKSNPQNKCQRYISAALLLAMTIKSIEDIQIILLSDIISLPNKSTLIVNNLFHSVKIQLVSQKKQYSKDIFSRKQQCLQFLKKLYETKLSNSEYQAKFTRTLNFFKHIIQQLKKASIQNKLYESKQWYQLWYNKILFQYKWQSGNQKPDQMSQTYLKIYWGLVKLIKIDISFPKQKYNTDTLLLFYDTFKKETSNYYLQDIKKFKDQIKM